MFKKFANEDLTAWYPAKEDKTALADDWTFEKQIKLAEVCSKAGFPFALGCGSNSTDANRPTKSFNSAKPNVRSRVIKARALSTPRSRR